MLAAHGLDGVAEQPLVNSGYSGSALTRLARGDGASFVLKRFAIERDWIMRATDDAGAREAAFAAAGIALPSSIETPTLGVASEGSSHALLMRDITASLLPEGVIGRRALDAIIGGIAALHRTPLPAAPAPWCDIRRRLLLLSPAGARVAAAYGAPVAADLVRGWELFATLATPPVARLVAALHAEPTPLLEALAGLPAAFLHGDLKFDNIGIEPDGGLWLIDWAMVMHAPPAIELGWFLAINSRRLPVPLDDVLDRYADAARLRPDERRAHDALAAVCGLVLRGWRKALDADAGATAELAWWCGRGEAARPLLAV